MLYTYTCRTILYNRKSVTGNIDRTSIFQGDEAVQPWTEYSDPNPLEHHLSASLFLFWHLYNNAYVHRKAKFIEILAD